jgi:hypothetical protein
MSFLRLVRVLAASTQPARPRRSDGVVRACAEAPRRERAAVRAAGSSEPMTARERTKGHVRPRCDLRGPPGRFARGDGAR